MSSWGKPRFKKKQECPALTRKNYNIYGGAGYFSRTGAFRNKSVNVEKVVVQYEVKTDYLKDCVENGVKYRGSLE